VETDNAAREYGLDGMNGMLHQNIEFEMEWAFAAFSRPFHLQITADAIGKSGMALERLCNRCTNLSLQMKIEARAAF